MSSGSSIFFFTKFWTRESEKRLTAVSCDATTAYITGNCSRSANDMSKSRMAACSLLLPKKLSIWWLKRRLTHSGSRYLNSKFRHSLPQLACRVHDRLHALARANQCIKRVHQAFAGQAGDGSSESGCRAVARHPDIQLS